jgi:glutathione S-transferase
MKLYGFAPSPNTWKVRAVAAHLGVPLELEMVDLLKGGSHTPDYLAINPTGRTPALVDGDFKLWESTAIMQYIASRKPNSLWPKDARVQADIARWQSWQLAHFSKEACEPLIFQRLVKKLMNLGAPDEAVVAKGL